MFDEPVEAIGVVGIGDMGFPIAETLVGAGYAVTAFDLRREALEAFEDAGGDAAGSPAAVARECESVHLVVVDDDQAEDVISGESGVFAGFEAKDGGGLVVVHSTLLPETVTGFAEEAPDGVTVIDAAVSGGPPRAAAGDLSVMVGGPDSVVGGYGPVLEAIAREVYHLGPVGSGLVAKLTNNSLYHAAAAATLEALEVGAEFGIDEEDLLEVYGQSSGNSFFVQNFEYFTEERPGTHPEGPEGIVRNGRKNLYQYLTLTNDLEVEVPVGGLVSQQYPALMRAAIGDVDAE